MVGSGSAQLVRTINVPNVTTARKLSGVAGWIKLAIRSFAAAGLFAAAQLGAAQALSMFVWSTVPAPEVWRRQLMWLLFIFAAAVLGGVAGGRRSVRAIRIAIANRRAIAASQRHSGLTLHKSGMRGRQPARGHRGQGEDRRQGPRLRRRGRPRRRDRVRRARRGRRVRAGLAAGPERLRPGRHAHDGPHRRPRHRRRRRRVAAGPGRRPRSPPTPARPSCGPGSSG